MDITKDKLRILWYEDENGEFLGEPDYHSNRGPEIPEGSRYQVSQFPLQLITTYLRMNDDGTGAEMGHATASFPENLPVAIVNAGHWGLGDAILMSALSCERCLNVLLWEYQYYYPLSRGGVEHDRGYAEYTEEWLRCPTECLFCEDMVPPREERSNLKSRAVPIGDIPS